MCVQLSVLRARSPKSGFLYRNPLYSARSDKWRKSIIGADVVKEGTSSLRTCTRHKAVEIARGIEDKTAARGERITIDPREAQWKFDHHISCDGVHVGLDSGFPDAAAEIFFGISIVTIVGFCGEPTVEVVTVSDLKSASVGSVLFTAEVSVLKQRCSMDLWLLRKCRKSKVSIAAWDWPLPNGSSDEAIGSCGSSKFQSAISVR